MINWKVRTQSPQFWIGIVGVVASPILAYLGMSYTDITTWSTLGNIIVQFVTNPYLIGTVIVAVMSFLGVVTDPTTAGVGDSELAMTYDTPKPKHIEVA